ncbi:MAG: DinB family protein [Phycisphaerales bacterium]
MHYIQSIARSIEYDRNETLKLARAIPELVCDRQPAGLIQSPCWIICHLGLADTLQLASLTTGTRERGDYFEQFGPNSDHAKAREHMNSHFGSWHQAIDAVADMHAKLVKAIRDADADALAKPHPAESIREWFPTLNDHLMYIIWHEGNHGGQLRAWIHAAQHSGITTGM